MLSTFSKEHLIVEVYLEIDHVLEEAGHVITWPRPFGLLGLLVTTNQQLIHIFDTLLLQFADILQYRGGFLVACVESRSEVSVSQPERVLAVWISMW